ncbi:hypothetical protein Sez_1581 [Streptococcus equi subsp. zooepidemicus MGCS10565]|uniref:Uncharacterized protein n=1 Tax=Streptococcus equi subsp. zooepidemicus (strain MGCS10565) TaxID=552526 RepID=B4U4J7_STREM|nr:hypothetical protein Sez_1581 [Streptococcus equi subsp. zooepidemicus MGCS10565]AEJ25918.1 conserved hypothetical protein [Streptococcus equi subsp. zooepidemicus ATCC 35246]AIA68538.1 hypothetical protein Q426_00950 [Streptococcus equi subsp. zooepidemicus CY]
MELPSLILSCTLKASKWLILKEYSHWYKTNNQLSLTPQLTASKARSTKD